MRSGDRRGRLSLWLKPSMNMFEDDWRWVTCVSASKTLLFMNVSTSTTRIRKDNVGALVFCSLNYVVRGAKVTLERLHRAHKRSQLHPMNLGMDIQPRITANHSSRPSLLESSVIRKETAPLIHAVASADGEDDPRKRRTLPCSFFSNCALLRLY